VVRSAAARTRAEWGGRGPLRRGAPTPADAARAHLRFAFLDGCGGDSPGGQHSAAGALLLSPPAFPSQVH
jgi:hypothetical protein